ncbi:hypothetical protein [Ruegeria marina]|uniref:hypothetical protein n=1 Tax=Ruegeria marina TaxID=639004 RepID=UPI001C40A27B|nr:hypothetical protein [Ruegeria marina]
MNDAPLVDGIYLSWDQEEGDVQVSLPPSGDDLLHISARVGGQPRWLCLNIALGETAFEPGAVFGVVAGLQGCAGETLRMFVRTSREGETTDTPLSEEIAGSREATVQVTMHRLTASEGLVGAPGFHTLVVDLPFHDFDLVLHDMHLFVLQSGKALGVMPTTLGNFT